MFSSPINYPYQGGYIYSYLENLQAAGVPVPSNINNSPYQKRGLAGPEFEEALLPFNNSIMNGNKIDKRQKSEKLVGPEQQPPIVTATSTKSSGHPGKSSNSLLGHSENQRHISTNMPTKTKNLALFKSTSTRKDSKATVFAPGLAKMPRPRYVVAQNDLANKNK
jgi:hypothetical protein